MGKQVNFFMTPSEEQEFLSYIKSNGEILYTLNGERIHYNHNLDSKLSQVCIASKESKIYKYKSIIDLELSEVILLSRCRYMDNKIYEGRIYIMTNYFNQDKRLIKKPDWFIQFYEKYAKWIKKNYKIDPENKRWYIGNDAYKAYFKREKIMMPLFGTEIKFDKR